VLHAKGVATVVITSMVLPGRSDLVLFASDTRSRVEPGTNAYVNVNHAGFART